MNYIVYLTIVGFLMTGCVHSNSIRDPQAIPGETFSPGGKINSPKDPYSHGNNIAGAYICFHKTILVKPGFKPTVYEATSSPSQVPDHLKLKSPSCGFYTDGNKNVVIKAGTMIKATDSGSSFSWGGGRDHTDMFPKMMTMACIHENEDNEHYFNGENPYRFMYLKYVNNYFADMMTVTNSEHFKCQPK